MFQPNGPTSRLTTGEITECLTTAFDSLSPKDQANIKRIMAPLLEIRGLGPKSVLHLLFALFRADDLARLEESLKGG